MKINIIIDLLSVADRDINGEKKDIMQNNKKLTTKNMTRGTSAWVNEHWLHALWTGSHIKSYNNAVASRIIGRQYEAMVTAMIL